MVDADTANEDCVVCGEDGGCYITSGSHRAGPYCVRHRWALGVYVFERDKLTAQDRFDGYVEEFHKKMKDESK